MMKKLKHSPRLFWTHILDSSKDPNLLILTARPHDLLMNSSVKRIYLLMANKLKSNQLEYLCVNDKQTKKQPI